MNIFSKTLWCFQLMVYVTPIVCNYMHTQRPETVSEIFWRLCHFSEALYIINFVIYWSLSDNDPLKRNARDNVTVLSGLLKGLYKKLSCPLRLLHWFCEIHLRNMPMFSSLFEAVSVTWHWTNNFFFQELPSERLPGLSKYRLFIWLAYAFVSFADCK